MSFSLSYSKSELKGKFDEIIENAKNLFPEMYNRAKKLIKENSLKEYIFNKDENRIFLAVGRDAQYLLSEYMVNGRLHFFCSCPDFFFHSLLKSEKEKRRPFCYHILARIILERSRLERSTLEENTFKDTISEEEAYWIELVSHLTE